MNPCADYRGLPPLIGGLRTHPRGKASVVIKEARVQEIELWNGRKQLGAVL